MRSIGAGQEGRLEQVVPDDVARDEALRLNDELASVGIHVLARRPQSVGHADEAADAELERLDDVAVLLP